MWVIFAPVFYGLLLILFVGIVFGLGVWFRHRYAVTRRTE